MTYNGQQYTQPFEIWRDVTLPSTDADLVAEHRVCSATSSSAMNDVVDKINRIEIMRMQVEDLRKANAAQQGSSTRRSPAIYKRMYDTELHFLSRTEMHSDDKWYVEKYKLYLNLVWLLAEVGGSGGDVAGGVGYRPTNAALSVFEDRLKELDAGNADFKKLMQEVEAFNKAQRRQAAGDYGQDADLTAALTRGGEVGRLKGSEAQRLGGWAKTKSDEESVGLGEAFWPLSLFQAFSPLGF